MHFIVDINKDFLYKRSIVNYNFRNIRKSISKRLLRDSNLKIWLKMEDFQNNFYTLTPSFKVRILIPLPAGGDNIDVTAFSMQNSLKKSEIALNLLLI